MSTLLQLLAQMDTTNVSDGTPILSGETHNAATWFFIATFTVFVLLITFKTSKRNSVERE